MALDDASAAGARPQQVSRGLNLTLELADSRKMPELLFAIECVKEKTHAALRELHFVHFARFLPVRGNGALLVITEFDGPLRPYVLDFVIAIGDVFDIILSYVKDAPPLPVKEYPQEFMRFIEANNRVVVAPPIFQWDDYPVYSAYPERTVIDILGPRRDLPPLPQEPQPAVIDRSDVQGNILRSFAADYARHYALRIDDPAAGREFLHLLADGDGSVCPRVTSDAPWERRPLYLLNVGVTALGLRALGVPRALRERLPQAFLDGPAHPARARANGDEEASAPANWELGAPGSAIHLMVSLYGDDEVDSREDFDLRHGQLTAWWTKNRVALVSSHEARALPGGEVHFGYTEGMAQPRVAGVADGAGNDMQPLASAGEFLLGEDFRSVYGGRSLGGMPAAFCRNATFAAVRLLEQDVEAFERLLDDASQAAGLDRELIAAKLMGRWRNGTPLSMAPADHMPQPAVPPQHYNEFDYAPSRAHPGVYNDHEGLVCPVGAHMRRMNPRSARVAGRPYTRRLIRRGMPYGPAWDGATSARRGLFGLFICADLERQFEFLMEQWAHGDIAASGIRGTQDPILGNQKSQGAFLIPVEGRRQPIGISVPRLVTTRGSLYLLMPGLAGLRHLAAGEGFEDAGAAKLFAVERTFGPAATMAFDPSSFDPKDPRFLADPHPFYAQFRRHAPVALVRRDRGGGSAYESYWVFSHELVTEVCRREQVFLKRPVRELGSARGLFYMDPPRHTEARSLLNPAFGAATRDSASVAQAQAARALQDLTGGPAAFDVIRNYTNRVTRDSFMAMFGMPAGDWQEIGDLVDTVLMFHDEMLPEGARAPGKCAAALLLRRFHVERERCPAQPAASELLCRMQALAAAGSLAGDEVNYTALHFALGGYLSTDFLLGTAIHHLLTRPAALAAYRAADRGGRSKALQELMRLDAPFQMADRYAAEDTALGGYRIPKDARVTVVYGSANRDPAVFGPHADQLDLTREMPAGANYVFGHGIHYCIGAPMVADVAPVVLDALLDAMPQLALAPGVPQRMTDPYFRGFSRLELLR